MGMNNTFLYVVTLLIWGSTWLAIEFQLGVVQSHVLSQVLVFLPGQKVTGFPIKPAVLLQHPWHVRAARRYEQR